MGTVRAGSPPGPHRGRGRPGGSTRPGIRAGARTGAQAGFTLLEMVVTLLLVGVSLFLAAGMLQEAQVLSAGATRKLQDPLGALAVTRLRSDVQGSRAVLSPSLPLLWTGDPLSLSGYYPETILTWRLREGRLERILSDAASGEVLSTQVWLSGTASWRWRLVDRSLVDVEVAWHRAPELASYALDGRPGSRPTEVLEVDGLRLALRGRGWGVGW